MDFGQVIETHFANTILESEFVKESYSSLSLRGFNAENTIACVGVCRDEMTRTFIDEVQSVWGEAFNFSSLGGMLFLGKTGFLAAHQHAPIEDGRERYVYYAMPHIAIDQDGNIGVCYRSGRSTPSGACGALMAFRQLLLDGDLDLELDLDDIEQSLLKHRLFRAIKYGDIPDLITLTKLAQRVILQDLEHLVAITVNPSISDYAILSGIQIHGRGWEQYVCPGTMYVVTNGQRAELTLTNT